MESHYLSRKGRPGFSPERENTGVFTILMSSRTDFMSVAGWREREGTKLGGMIN
jgi:hypothetical protein